MLKFKCLYSYYKITRIFKAIFSQSKNQPLMISISVLQIHSFRHPVQTKLRILPWPTWPGKNSGPTDNDAVGDFVFAHAGSLVPRSLVLGPCYWVLGPQSLVHAGAGFDVSPGWWIIFDIYVLGRRSPSSCSVVANMCVPCHIWCHSNYKYIRVHAHQKTTQLSMHPPTYTRVWWEPHLDMFILLSKH